MASGQCPATTPRSLLWVGSPSLRTSQIDKYLRSRPARVTVDDHIRLLRQYNKTKDVGQQLIGLIAESRGIPLGAVYKDGEYGVCADD